MNLDISENTSDAARKREWAAISLLAVLKIDLIAKDGSKFQAGLGEIAPFLKKDVKPTDFLNQQAAAEFADKMVGFNTKTLAELTPIVAEELLKQNLVQLRKLTPTDFATKSIVDLGIKLFF